MMARDLKEFHSVFWRAKVMILTPNIVGAVAGRMINQRIHLHTFSIEYQQLPTHDSFYVAGRTTW